MKNLKISYVNILGCKIINETYRKGKNSYKLDLLVGNSQIELVSFHNPPKRPSYPEARGLRHLAFEVDNIEKTIKHLQSKNISIEPIRVDELTGKKFSFFKDPDDLPLEIYEK